MGLFPWLSSIVVIGLFAYLGAPLWVWTTVAFLVFAFISFMSAPLGVTWVLAWALFAFIACVLNIPTLRRPLCSRFLLKIVRAKLPPISATEREAIHAGDVWWEGQLFQGQPRWDEIHHFNITALTQAEQDFLNHEVEHLCQLIDSWQQSREAKHSEAVWDYIKQARFFAMLIPKAYGGLEFSPMASSTVVSKIATRDMSTAVTVMVPNSLGPAELLLHYGTEAQKSYYLPRLARAEDIPCFGLTALEAGSDAASMSDKGIVTYGEHEGKRVLGLKLTFAKRYITLAPVATVLGLAVKCFDPDKLLGDTLSLGITLCLIPAAYPGVKTGPYHLPIGGSFPNGTLEGKDVFIPLDWVIGGADNIGHGWRMLMECLSAGRGISLPALATACAKISYRSTGAYAQVRKQFNVSIGQFEGIQQDLARIAGFTYILEAMRVVTASAISHGKKPAVVSAIAKYHMTELSRLIINHAMDIHGGKGVINGPSNYLASTYTGIPVAITVEGANILTRNLIIFGQGAIRCHPYLLHEMLSAQQHSHEGLVSFDKHIFQHLGYTLKNTVRSLVQSLSAGLLLRDLPSGELRRYAAQITRMSTALAFISDITLITLGGKLKRMENLSARLGDVLSHLYMAVSVLKYHESSELRGQASEHEQALARWALDYCLYRCQEAWVGFFDNLGSNALGFIFKRWVFPYGQAYRYPSDALSQRVAEIMMMPGALRDKISAHMFTGDDTSPIGRVDAALQAQMETKPLWDKLTQAQKNKQFSPELSLGERIDAAKQQKILNQTEYEEVKQAYDLYIKAIAVDEFHA